MIVDTCKYEVFSQIASLVKYGCHLHCQPLWINQDPKTNRLCFPKHYSGVGGGERQRGDYMAT